MNNSDSYTAAIAADPALPPADMQQIATSRPDLLPALASNPSLYPGLRDWIAEQGILEARPSVAQPTEAVGVFGLASSSKMDSTLANGPMVSTQPNGSHAVPQRTGLWITAFVLFAVQTVSGELYAFFDTSEVPSVLVLAAELAWTVMFAVAAVISAPSRRKPWVVILGVIVPSLYWLNSAYEVIQSIRYVQVNYALSETIHLYGLLVLIVCVPVAFGLARPLMGGAAWIAIAGLIGAIIGFAFLAGSSVLPFHISYLQAMLGYILIVLVGVGAAELLNRKTLSTAPPSPESGMNVMSGSGSTSYGYSADGSLILQPVPPVQGYDPARNYSTGTYGTQSPGTNTMAVLSLVFAFFFSLAAVIMGHVALSQIKRTGEGGRGLAIAGLILGYLGLVAWVIVAVLYFALIGALMSY